MDLTRKILGGVLTVRLLITQFKGWHLCSTGNQGFHTLVTIKKLSNKYIIFKIVKEFTNYYLILCYMTQFTIVLLL